MNERIRELEMQVARSFDPLKDYSDQHYFQEFNRRFAELIVRECIAVHEDDYGVDIIGDVLKKHFGVE